MIGKVIGLIERIFHYDEFGTWEPGRTMNSITEEMKAIIASQVQSVCDWDDRTSPDEYPDHLLITPDELTCLFENVLERAISAGEAVQPVAEVVWYDPRLILFPMEPRKIIDASMAFMDVSPIGTKLYAHPAPANAGVVPDGWQPIASAPRDEEFIGRCGAEYKGFSCFWNGEAFVHYDADDGHIYYPVTEWMPFPAPKPQPPEGE